MNKCLKTVKAWSIWPLFTTCLNVLLPLYDFQTVSYIFCAPTSPAYAPLFLTTPFLPSFFTPWLLIYWLLLPFPSVVKPLWPSNFGMPLTPSLLILLHMGCHFWHPNFQMSTQPSQHCRLNL